MTWTLPLALACGAPAVIALVEWLWTRAGPREVGFWSFARAVDGTCHLRWGRGQSPVVRFGLPAARGRARAVRIGGRWAVELRAYLDGHAGLVARVCRPARPPLRWRTPGLAPWVGAEGAASIETTAPEAWAALWSDPTLQSALDALDGPLECLLAGRVLIVRQLGSAGETAGAVVERLGPGGVSALRTWTAALEEAVAAGCPACGQPLDDDPHRCPDCGAAHHRGCREMVGGCTAPDCLHAADRPPSVPIGPR